MGVFEKVPGSGVWWVRYTDQYGRLHREKAGSKSLAKKAYTKRKSDIREGKFFPDQLRQMKETLFRDMGKLYLEEHSRVSKRSHQTDVYMMPRLVDAFGDKALSLITVQDIERFKASIIQEVSSATVNRYLALLSGVFNKAVAWGKTSNNPLSSVKKLKENNARVRYLCEDEENVLKQVFPSGHWPKVELAFNTGMRRGEQFNLKWPDVDFQARSIRLVEPKSGELEHVRMNDRASDLLRSVPSRLKSEWVFPSGTGKTPTNANNFINRVFKPALEKANIKDFHWHDLRHTFASRLVMAGVDLRTVQELMRHRSITMTLRYSHLSPSHTLDAVNKLCFEAQRGDTRGDTGRKQSVASGV